MIPNALSYSSIASVYFSWLTRSLPRALKSWTMLWVGDPGISRVPTIAMPLMRVRSGSGAEERWSRVGPQREEFKG